MVTYGLWPGAFITCHKIGEGGCQELWGVMVVPAAGESGHYRAHGRKK